MTIDIPTLQAYIRVKLAMQAFVSVLQGVGIYLQPIPALQQIVRERLDGDSSA